MLAKPVEQKEAQEGWLTSKEAKKALKVSSCELMHLRVAGALPFKKQGNAYFYQIPTPLKADCVVPK